MPKICKIEGCNNPVFSRKTMLCKFHTPNKPIASKSKPKPISASRMDDMKKYSKAKKEYLAEHDTCQFPGCKKRHMPASNPNQTLEIHHKKGRDGEMLYNKEFFMAVCRFHHGYIEMHREESYEKGWLLKRTTR